MAQIDDISDHGIECLKKAALVRNDSYKSRYSLRVATKEEHISSFNSIDVVKTTIGVTATKINTPTASGEFIITNKSDEIIYIGGSDVAIATGLPLEKNDILKFTDYQLANNNLIYGIAANSTSVYAIGCL